MPRALLTVALAGLAGWLGGARAYAQPAPKDAQAEKTLADAMGNDYLQTRFDQAEKKLRAAIEACGAAGCSPKVKGRLHMALGTVLAHGKKQLEDARDAFVDALGIDPDAKPDPDLLSTEISYAFEQARAALGAAASPSAPALAVGAIPEQRVRTPVPVYAEVRADLLDKTKRVTLWYLPPGAAEPRSLVMKKLRDRGFGIQVPCGEVRAEGALRYWVSAEGADGAILGAGGSRDKPLETAIKASIQGEAPRWPGFAPPAQCADVEKDKPKQCLDDRQCNAGFSCLGGACAPRGPEPVEEDVRENWMSINFWPDVAFFSGDDVCTASGQSDGHYVCLREDGTRYDGTPTAGIADNVNPGFALGTMRVALGYDRVLFDQLTIGARVGFAFGGTSEGGASFVPVHVEARAQYFFFPSPPGGVGVRPFAMVTAGLAQVDARVDVQVLEDAAACGADPNDANSECTTPGPSGVIEQRGQTLDAYKQAGLGFASLGAGVAYTPVDGLALNLGVRAGVTFPVVVLLVTPEVGVALGF